MSACRSLQDVSRDTPPYRDAHSAILSALNVDARSLYKPASWQALAMIGYREELPTAPGDLTKLERFQQDCMTLAFLHHRMPAHLWAVIVTRYAILPANQPDPRDAEAVERYHSEFNRIKVAVLVVAGHITYDDSMFARWAVANWAGKFEKSKARWDRWADHDLSIRTLKRHYGEQIKPRLTGLLKQAEATAERLLNDSGMIERVAA